MGYGKAADRAGSSAAEAACALTCECWDCRSYRRHLLKVAAMMLLACGFLGDLAWQAGLWRDGGNAAARPEVLEVASLPLPDLF